MADQRQYPRNRALESAIGPLVFTSLNDGVAETLSIFRRALGDGKIKPDNKKPFEN